MGRFAIAVIFLGLVMGACGPSGEPKDSTGTESTGFSVTTDSTSDSDQLLLTSKPTFVDPVIDATRMVSSDITASVGGSLTLVLSEEVSATLDIPSGALSDDQVVTLTAVNSLNVGDSGVFGVDIQPAGLYFTFDAMPRLTFNGVSSNSEVVGWDDDNVADVLMALPTSETSVMVSMLHFSGAAVSGRPAQAKTTLDLAMEEFRRDLSAEQKRELAGTNDDQSREVFTEKWLNRFRELESTFVRPLIISASNGPCDDRARQAMLMALSLEIKSQWLGSEEYLINSEAASKYYQHQIDCARKACELGDSTALGKYFKAQFEGYFLRVSDGNIPDEDFEYFSKCGLYRASVIGRTIWKLPTGDVNETFIAKGVVSADQTIKGNLLPMSVVSGGWEGLDSAETSLLLSGLSLFGGGDGNVSVDCTFSPIGPSVAQVDVVRADSAPSTPGIETTIRFKPFIASGARTCAGYESPYNAEVTFATHMVLTKFPFNGVDIHHEFSADEKDRFGVFRVSEKFDLGRFFPPGVGAPGSGQISMTIQPVAHYQVPDAVDLSTENLVDVYTLVAYG